MKSKKLVESWEEVVSNEGELLFWLLKFFNFFENRC